MSKYEQRLADCLKYKEFLDSITPPEHIQKIKNSVCAFCPFLPAVSSFALSPPSFSPIIFHYAFFTTTAYYSLCRVCALCVCLMWICFACCVLQRAQRDAPSAKSTSSGSASASASILEDRAENCESAEAEIDADDDGLLSQERSDLLRVRVRLPRLSSLARCSFHNH